MTDAPNPKRGRPPPLEGEVSSSLSNVFNASDTHVAHRPTVRAVREERLALCRRHPRHYRQGPLALSYLQHHDASVSARESAATENEESQGHQGNQGTLSLSAPSCPFSPPHQNQLSCSAS